MSAKKGMRCFQNLQKHILMHAEPNGALQSLSSASEYKTNNMKAFFKTVRCKKRRKKKDDETFTNVVIFHRISSANWASSAFTHWDSVNKLPLRSSRILWDKTTSLTWKDSSSQNATTTPPIWAHHQTNHCLATAETKTCQQTDEKMLSSRKATLCSTKKEKQIKARMCWGLLALCSSRWGCSSCCEAGNQNSDQFTSCGWPSGWTRVEFSLG